MSSHLRNGITGWVRGMRKGDCLLCGVLWYVCPFATSSSSSHDSHCSCHSFWDWVCHSIWYKCLHSVSVCCTASGVGVCWVSQWMCGWINEDNIKFFCTWKKSWCPALLLLTTEIWTCQQTFLSFIFHNRKCGIFPPVVETEPRALFIPGKHSVIVNPQPKNMLNHLSLHKTRLNKSCGYDVQWFTNVIITKNHIDVFWPLIIPKKILKRQIFMYKI